MKRHVLIIFAVLCWMVVSASAQPQWAGTHGKWEIALFGGAAFGDESAAATPVDGESELRSVGLKLSDGYMLGLSITENLGQHFAAELGYSISNHPASFYNLHPVVIPRLELEHQVHGVRYSVLYYPLDRRHKLRPFVDVGAGVSLFRVDGESKERSENLGVTLTDRWKFTFNLGGGFKYMLNNSLGFRVDVRDSVSGVPDFGLPSQATTLPGFRPEGRQHLYQMSLGITYYLQP